MAQMRTKHSFEVILLKKILALLLSILMLFPSSAFFAEEEKAEEAPYEITMEESVLHTLEIVEEKGYDGRKGVTRADFVVSVLNLLGLADLPKTTTAFSDIPEDAYYSGAVKTATDMGIIKGFGDGTFNPDALLTIEQAVKIVLSATGFDVYASSYGGYPAGYLTVATVNGLLKNVTVGNFESCTWHDASIVLYNALTMDVLQQEEYPSGSYGTVEGENPLTMWLDVNTLKGVVTANEYTSLGNPKGSPKGKVMLDTKLFNAGKTDIADYLGYPVKIYYKEEFGEDTILLFTPDKNARIYEFTAEEISPSSTASVLKYYSGDKTAQLPIDGAHFIYNGKSATLTAPKLNITDGTIKAISYGGSKADVLFAESFVTYCADSVNTKSYSIVDKFTQGKVLFDIENNNADTIILKDGKEVSFSQIKKGNILSVMRSEDGLYTKVFLGTDKLDAALLEIFDDKILVDDGDGEYFITNNVKSHLSELILGTVKTFYLTYDGKIGGWGDSKAVGKYGYLITAAALGNGLSGSHEGTFRIYDPTSSKVKNFTSAEDIKFNGEFADTSGQKYTGRLIIEKLTDGGVVDHQLIKYVTNDEDKITAIYTAKRNTAEPLVPDAENFTLDYYVEYSGSTKIGDNSSKLTSNRSRYTWMDDTYGTIDTYISLRDTISIGIPKLASGEKLMDREDEIIVVPSNWFNESTAQMFFYQLRAYDMDENHVARVIVFRNDAGAGSGTVPNHEHVLVDRISETEDKDGHPVTKIYGWIGAQKVDYIVDETSPLIKPSDLKLKSGDVIRVATAPDVIRIVKIFTTTPDDGKGEYLIYSDGFRDWQMTSTSDQYTAMPSPNYEQMSIALYDRVKRIDENGFVIHSDLGNGKILPRLLTMRPRDICFSVWDEATGKTRAGSASDIDPDNPRQTVLVNVSYHRAHEVCIFNWKTPQNPTWKGTYTSGDYKTTP